MVKRELVILGDFMTWRIVGRIRDVFTTKGVGAFTVFAAKAWNTLPINIRPSTTVGVLQTALKTHLFEAYFE